MPREVFEVKIFSYMRFTAIYFLKAVPEETHRYKIMLEKHEAEIEAHKTLDDFMLKTKRDLEGLENDCKTKAILIHELNNYIRSVHTEFAQGEVSGAIMVNDVIYRNKDVKHINLN